MRDWGAERVAREAGAQLLRHAPGGPTGVAIDSRAIVGGELFVGLPGSRVDGAAFAAAAVQAGAWGALVAADAAPATELSAGAVLTVAEPLIALQQLARAWRRELGAPVVAITGSTGKTSTKEIVAAMLGDTLATHASPLNRNTEIGLPLAILDAAPGTEALVLELAMRGAGQIAELTAICEPDIGVIVNVGPAHLELLGSLEAIAAAKAELLEGLRPGAAAIVPAGEPLLEAHLRDDLRIIRCGADGDVRLSAVGDRGVEIDAEGELITIEPGFRARHQLSNLLIAVAVARVLGAAIPERLDVAFAAGRGQRIALPGGVTLIDDCYNANPMSMQAALDDLAATPAGRRIAVLGDMLELGPDERHYHSELGPAADAAGVDVLITVGRRAAWAGECFAGELHTVPDAHAAGELLVGLLRDDDVVLVKGSRAVGLEIVGELAAGARG